MNNTYKKPFNNVRSISQFPILFFLFVMALCPVLGQNGHQKKLLQPKDYAMWHNMRFPLISGDGKWTSYQLDYEPDKDTLVVMSIKGQIKYKLPNANGGQFAPSKHPTLFAFTHPTNGVGVFNLIDKTINWIKEAQYFEFSMDGNYVAYYNLKPKNGYLQLMDIEKNKSIIINDVQDFEFDTTSKKAAYISNDSTKTTVSLIKLNSLIQSVILSSLTSEFTHLVWDAAGDRLAFIESNSGSKQRLYYFEYNNTPMLKEIDNLNIKELGALEISNLSPSFSNDGERIFFATHHRTNEPIKGDLDTIKVQVWKGTDKLIYPHAKLYQEFEIKDKMAVWWPNIGRIFQIGTSENPMVILTGDQKFAITYNPLAYEPQFKETAKSDFFIINLETGVSKKFLSKMETAPRYLSMSPNGETIAYFKENNWWLYDIRMEKHKNCTHNFETPLTYKHAPGTTRITPFGYMGWTTNNEFLIYDEFDIWKISANDILPERLTSGRDSRTNYRKYYYLYDGFYPLGYAKENLAYDLSQDIILNTQDSMFNYGFAQMTSTGKLIPFLKETGNISGLRKAKFRDTYIFMIEKYNQPPELYKLKGTKQNLLAKSNLQQLNFHQGKTELISFKNKEGDSLKGLLHYPDNYQEGMHYPMVVSVYQIISPQFQKYQNPSVYNEDGFNIRNFTAAGYFVLEPDILIQNKSPGISATDCTVAAVMAVLKSGMIEKSAIGLIGHSFGGYEAAFIITQTDIFAAAVVGSGVFDITTFAHTVNPETGVVGFIDIEDKQWKMEETFYNAKEKYRGNSPIENANKITTPTLIYTGNLDFRIDWRQSLEMYLSLRRQGVEVELLVYENEFHTMSKTENQKDLTQRIETWFSQYLKKKK